MPATIPVKTTFKNKMRWIAVLPAAFLAVVIVMFPVHWAVMLVHFFGISGSSGITTEDGKDLLATIPVETLELFLNAFFVPFAFFLPATYLAVSHKFVTA